MKSSTVITALAGGVLAAFTLFGTASAKDAQTLSLDNFIGTVNIVTKGPDIAVEGARAGTLTQRKHSTSIDGGQILDSSKCKQTKGRISISLGQKSWRKRIGGYKDLDDYPKLDIAVPEGSTLKIRNSIIFGEAQDFGAVDAVIKSCGSFAVENINGPLDLRVSGSGGFSANSAQTANVRISGSGDVDIEKLGPAKLTTSGSGDIDVGTIKGAAAITTSGSGDVEIETLLGDLTYEGRGSSDFSAERVDGNIDIKVSGSGDVDIDEGTAEKLLIAAAGSSEIEFSGTAQNVVIMSGGSSDIEVKKVTGEIEVSRTGSSDISINGKRYKGQ
jgi:hypothetical protein